MRRLTLITGAFLFAVLTCLSCGGGGGSDGGGAGDLQGMWLGWIEDDAGKVEEFSLQIDGDGNITEVQIGGANTGQTGWLNEDWDENLFYLRDFTGSPFSGGILIVDPQISHATFGAYGSGSSNYYCGVLEKGATMFPAYASSDIVASYPVGGAYIFTNDGGTYLWEGDAVSMTVDPALAFTGSAPEGPFSGAFDPAMFNSNNGSYGGSFTRSTMMTMDITAFVSPDGTAVAAWAWENGTSPISLEEFILMGFTE